MIIGEHPCRAAHASEQLPDARRDGIESALVLRQILVLRDLGDVKLSATVSGQPTSVCVWGATCDRPAACQNPSGTSDLRNLPAGELYFSLTTGSAPPAVQQPYALLVTTSPLWMLDLVRGISSRFTFDGVFQTSAIWR